MAKIMDLFGENNKDLVGLSYEELKTLASSCTNCPLAETRTQVVFGEGPVPAKIMLIGEGPGEQEDLKGVPFVGRAGQLLTKILDSIGIKRPDDIYIANTVKCRPPGNRTPLLTELTACYPYLEAQIRIVKPKVVLLAGSPATKTVLQTTESISKVRGKWFKIPGTEISAMPIFHPSYLLRYASRDKGSPKWLTWKDMQEVKHALDYFDKLEELEK